MLNRVLNVKIVWLPVIWNVFLNERFVSIIASDYIRLLCIALLHLVHPWRFGDILLLVVYLAQYLLLPEYLNLNLLIILATPKMESVRFKDFLETASFKRNEWLHILQKDLLVLFLLSFLG